MSVAKMKAVLALLGYRQNSLDCNLELLVTFATFSEE